MTPGQIETILYQRLTNLHPPINGHIYYRGMRPIQANNKTPTQDAVIAVLSADDNQQQRGSALINIYTPDILTAEGTFLRDKLNTDLLEQYLATIPPLLNRQGLPHFIATSAPLTLPQPEIHQHLVSLKLDFFTLQKYKQY